MTRHTVKLVGGVTPTPGLGKHGGQLDAAPFLHAAIREGARLAAEDREFTGDARRNTNTAFPGVGLVAALAGMTPRTLHRLYAGECKTIGLDFVDRFCCATGRHLQDLYPHLYDAEQADADATMADALAEAGGSFQRSRSLYNRKRAALAAEQSVRAAA